MNNRCAGHSRMRVGGYLRGKSLSRLLCLAGAAVILLAVAPPGHAYNVLIYRQDPYVPLDYYINRFTFAAASIDKKADETISEAHDGVVEAIKRSFRTWSDVPTSSWVAHFENYSAPDALALVDAETAISDGLSVVSFETLPSGALGMASIWGEGGSYVDRFVVETDIILNRNTTWYWTTDLDKIIEAQQFYTTGYSYVDVETVMLHEIGHAVGLAHVSATAKIYVADTDNDQIVSTTNEGSSASTISSFTSHSGSESFSGPYGIAFDPTNHYLFVADTGNHRMIKLDDGGNFVAKWGALSGLENPASGRFRSPEDVAVDSDGRVYVADTGNNRIQKFTSGGGYLTKWGSEGTGDGKFDNPRGIAVDWYLGNDYVYVADTDNHRIQKFDSSGNFIAWWGYDGSNTPELYPNNVHTANSGKTGHATSLDGGFSSPRGVAVDAYGYVYVADTGNDRVQKFSAAGKHIESWTVTSPKDVDIDFNHLTYIGYVYVIGTSAVYKFEFDPDSFGYLQVATWDSTGQGIAVDLQDEDKVMYGYYTIVNRKLTHDEVNGISSLYPGAVTAPKEGGGGCFIATAAFGSPLAEEIRYLSRFRDEYLLKSKPGKALVRLYYRYSPALAGKIRDHEGCRRLIRMGLRPLIWFSRLLTR